MSRNKGVRIEYRPLKDGRQSIRLFWERDGKRHHERLDLYLEPKSKSTTARNDNVKRLAEQRRQDLNDAIFGDPEVIGRINGIQTPFLTFVETFAATRTNVTWVTLQRHLRSFIGERELRFSDITTQWIEAFKTYLLRTKGLKNNSAEKYLAHLNTTLKAAVDARIIFRNPYEKVRRLKVERSLRVYLTESELRLLVNTPCVNKETKRAFLFACASGLRYSDVSVLRWKDISDDILSFRQQKTKTVQYLPLNRTAIELLGDRGDPAHLVFDLPNRNYMNKLLKRWAQAAGVTKSISFHTSRHSYAVIMLSRGADTFFVKIVLGHKNIETTMLYLDMSTQTLRRLSALFPDILSPEQQALPVSGDTRDPFAAPVDHAWAGTASGRGDANPVHTTITSSNPTESAT